MATSFVSRSFTTEVWSEYEAERDESKYNQDEGMTQQASEGGSSEEMAARGSKGGQVSSDSAGHEGMAERGRLGGQASAEKAGHEGMAERGRKGGRVSAERAGHEGMAERGRKGGQAKGSKQMSSEFDAEHMYRFAGNR